MHVAIVYESMFGNTHAIAKAIAEGARAGNPDVEVTVPRSLTPHQPRSAGPVCSLSVGRPTCAP